MTALSCSQLQAGRTTPVAQRPSSQQTAGGLEPRTFSTLYASGRRFNQLSYLLLRNISFGLMLLTYDIAMCFRVQHIILTSAFVSFFMKLAKEEGLNFPTVETVMLSGQLYSAKFRRDAMKYFNANLWVSNKSPHSLVNGMKASLWKNNTIFTPQWPVLNNYDPSHHHWNQILIFYMVNSLSLMQIGNKMLPSHKSPAIHDLKLKSKK